MANPDKLNMLLQQQYDILVEMDTLLNWMSLFVAVLILTTMLSGLLAFVSFCKWRRFVLVNKPMKTKNLWGWGSIALTLAFLIATYSTYHSFTHVQAELEWVDLQKAEVKNRIRAIK